MRMRRNFHGLALTVLAALFMLSGASLVALADVVEPDADTVTSGNQGSLDLGTVAPGAVLSPSVSFQLACTGNKHVDSGQTVGLTFDPGTSTAPAGGSLSATDATIGAIPVSWPDDSGGAPNCGSPAPAPRQDNGNSTVTITAPATPGLHIYVVNYTNSLSPAGGSDSSSITAAANSVTFTLTVSSLPSNTTPIVAADSNTVTVDEGQSATNSGTFSDADSDPVTISSDVGTISQIGADSGTWDWSFDTTDGPDDSQTVTITADDGTDQSTTTFGLVVKNVAPTTTLDASNTVSVSEDATNAVTYSFTVTDPGNDTWTSTTGCGANGVKQSDTATSVTCLFPDGGNPSSLSGVTVSSEDSDFDSGNTSMQTVTIANIAPTLSGLTLADDVATACLSGNTVGLSFSFSDPALTYDAYAGSIDWGDANTDSFSSSPVSASHVYPSAGSFTIKVNAHDEDGGNAAEQNGAVSLLYNTTGILQPINLTGPRSSFKIGSTIPVKLKVTDCNGSPVSGLTLTVHLAQTDPTASGVNEVISNSSADSGTTMRFTGSPDNQYIFNLSTKRSQFNAGQDLTGGTYHVWITDDSIAQVDAYFDAKK